MLTELQKRKLTRLFYWYDTDGSGTLELSDFDRVVENIGAVRGRGPGTPEYDDMHLQFMFAWSSLVASADKNGDNIISLEEWLSHMDSLLKTKESADRTIDTLANLMSTLIDIDGDGQISPQEYGLFFKAYSIDERLLPGVFRQLDLNGDGHLSKDEIHKLVSDFYLSNDPKSPGNWIVGPY